MTTVLNVKQLSSMPPNGVYIGRAITYKFIRSSGSPFANPFRIGRDTQGVEWSREDVIQLYDSWIRNVESELYLRAQQELQDKILVCWCKPLACHGDMLARIANEASRAARI